jgi:integrase
VQESGKLVAIPTMRMLQPNPPRAGVLEWDGVEAICCRLSDDLRLAVLIGYTFGWRINSDVLPLTGRQVDLDAGTLRRQPGSSKNGDGRLIYLASELKVALADQRARARAPVRQLSWVVPWLFPHVSGTYRGKRRKTMRPALTIQ